MENLHIPLDVAIDLNWSRNKDGSYKINELLKLVDEENIITKYMKLDRFNEISCEANYRFINEAGLKQIKSHLSDSKQGD